MIKRRLIFLVLLLLPTLSSSAFAACTTGQTTCNTDTVNGAAIAAAINEPTVQNRIFAAWLSACFSNVWAEPASTAGNLQRIALCKNIVNGGIAKSTLVAMIINATTIPEILSTNCPAFPTGMLGGAAGCLADVDVQNSIAALLVVTVSSASTTATAVTGSTVLVVASVTGIAQGQNVYGAGIPAGAVVQNVSGTTVAISTPTTAALSATPVLFTISTGLP